MENHLPRVLVQWTFRGSITACYFSLAFLRRPFYALVLYCKRFHHDNVVEHAVGFTT